MMPYVSSFVSNFIDSKLCLGFTHDVVYCSTLIIHSTDSINLSYFQFLTITNMILQVTITMSLDANMYYLFSMFNPWPFIFIFLIKWCPLINSFLNLM